MLAGIAVASGGFCMATAVHIMGMKEYESMVRPALVGGTLGYLFAVVGLLFDLGRYYRIYFPFFVSPGPNSILFLVALSVALYLHCQLFEWAPAIFEWLNLKKLRRWWLKGMLGSHNCWAAAHHGASIRVRVPVPADAQQAPSPVVLGVTFHCCFLSQPFMAVSRW